MQLSTARPSVLVVADVHPDPNRSAGERRLHKFVSLMAEQAEVTLVAWQATGTGAGPAGVRVWPGHGRTAVHLALRSAGYEMIVFEFWRAAELFVPLARRLQPGTKLVVDTVDLEFVREARAVDVGAQQAGPAVEQRRARELAAYRSADALILTSPTEVDLYRQVSEAPKDLAVVTILVDDPGPREPSLEAVAVFVGNFWHAPNLDGLIWFTETIWPVVRRRHPGARLEVCGSNLIPPVVAIDGTDGVTIRGHVPELAAVYRSACVVVAPLRFGAGVKGKVCEAMAFGLPVVTTGVGAEGLDVEPGREILVAESSEDFAAGVIGLFEDPARARHMGQLGRARILDLCGEPRARQTIGEILDGLPAGRPPTWAQQLRRAALHALGHFVPLAQAVRNSLAPDPARSRRASPGPGTGPAPGRSPS